MQEQPGASGLSDREIVDAVLRDLAEAADRWEALVAEAETVTYSVDMGDIRAVADSDGKLVDLVLHPAVTTHYTHVELAERMNTAFAALRAEVEEDYQARYGGEPG
jgi:nitrogen fixation protein FixH